MGPFCPYTYLVEAHVRPILDDEGHDVGGEPELRGEHLDELGEVGLLVPAESAGCANPLDVDRRTWTQATPSSSVLPTRNVTRPSICARQNLIVSQAAWSGP